MTLRIGHGFDVHAFAEGRPLVLGGVHVPSQRGFEGHSDADVVAHALMDAILGAMRAGDIGGLFPDTDPAYEGADSMVLLARVADLARERGFRLVDCDCTIAAQAPKLAPYRDAMRERMAQAMGVDPSQVGLSATTTERLGFVGREEGIAAWAVALLELDECTGGAVPR
jgi:2-C-methyl-D-erythritol 2,4-cyclodiphosphate synthase